jgi:hypothetical protein
MNGPVLIPICSWFLTALSDFFNSLLAVPVLTMSKRRPYLIALMERRKSE